MKILVVANLYPNEEKPYWGTFVRECYLGYLENDVEADLSVIRKSGVVGYVLFYLKTFFKILFGKHDIVHVHYVSHSVFPVLVAKVFRNFKLILNFHGSDAFSELGEKGWKIRVKEILNKVALRYAALVVFPSENFKKQVVDYYSIKKECFVSPSGGVRKEIFEFRLGENNTVLFVGRLIKEKGAITAAKAIKKCEIGINKSTFIGSGPEEQEVKNLMGGHEKVVKGLMSHSELAMEMAKHDILLFPSIRKGESLGLILVEAIFSGMIPIAIKNGAVAEIFPVELVNDLIADNEQEFECKLERLINLDLLSKKDIKMKLLEYTVQRFEHGNVSINLVNKISKLMSENKYA